LLKKGSDDMPTSRLEHYINVAQLLAESGPQSFDELNSLIGNLPNDSLKQDLNFLLSIGSIEEDTKGGIYSIANSGIEVLHFFKIMPSKETIKMNR
jgi:hypothetical protein